VTLKMPAFEWVHVQLHQQKGMISLSPPTICNSAPNSKRPALHLYNVRQGIKGAKENTWAKSLNIILAISIKVLAHALSFSETLHAAFRFSF
ncbi:hypothetical protein ACRW5H_24380, partial [Escherichia coli]